MASLRASRVQTRHVRHPTLVTSAFAYGYAQHGADWEMGKCHSGREQSPIDLPRPAPATGNFTFDYVESALPYQLVHAGNTLAIELVGTPVGGIMHGGSWYDLLNVNVRVQSEHTWGGHREFAELHLVHKHHANSHILIAAVPLVPVMDGAGLNISAVQGFRASGIPAPNERAEVLIDKAVPLGLNSLFEGVNFFEYFGSTTAPPCAEDVTWLVRIGAVSISSTQGEFLRSAIMGMTAGYGNNRGLMPVNGRKVAVREAFRQRISPALAPGFPMSVKSATERELMARRDTAEARRLMKSAAERFHAVHGQAWVDNLVAE